jgi:hypothetical protein
MHDTCGRWEIVMPAAALCCAGGVVWSKTLAGACVGTLVGQGLGLRLRQRGERAGGGEAGRQWLEQGAALQRHAERSHTVCSRRHQDWRRQQRRRRRPHRRGGAACGSPAGVKAGCVLLLVVRRAVGRTVGCNSRALDRSGRPEAQRGLKWVPGNTAGGEKRLVQSPEAAQVGGGWVLLAAALLRTECASVTKSSGEGDGDAGLALCGCWGRHCPSPPSGGGWAGCLRVRCLRCLRCRL